MFDFDVIIAGLGAMGSATAFHLAGDGARVLGLDKFKPPHQFGSSHGLSRIIREAYFEHPLYVPLVQRAYELWTRLEQESARSLFRQTGGLMLGSPEGVLVSGAKRSAEIHQLTHQRLFAREIQTRFPAFVPPPEMVAIWEPRAGVLLPELAIQTLLELAARRGACLKYNEAMLDWEALNGGVRVRTSANTYTANQLLIAAGPWLGTLAPELKLPLRIERQVLFWFEPRSNPDSFLPSVCPIYICEYVPGRFFYGFPNLGDGIKVGVHHEGRPSVPDALDRVVKPEEVELARSLLDRILPDAAGDLKSCAVCMYTNTPDEHFILDFHPYHPQVLIASPCSGHGFKFAPVIGEIATLLLRNQTPPLDISLFRLSRFK